MPEATIPIQNDRASGLFLAVSLVLVVAGLIEPLADLFTRVSIDYGEGFNAYWAAVAMKGSSALYSPAHVMVSNNYPPLSFYLIGELGTVIGDNIFAGRVVALGALIATALLSGRIVILLGASVRWGWITCLLLLVYAEHAFGHFVAVDNPQWLAQAIMLVATIPLVRRPSGPSPLDCLGSAAAIVLAVLVKHNLFAFPLASALWMFSHYRGALIRWSLWIIVLAAMAGVGLFALYGNAVFVEIVAFKRTVDWHEFLSGLGKSACFIPMLFVNAAVRRGTGRDVRWLLFATAGLVGTLLGIVQRLGAGVYINAHFEALVGLVITTGYAFGNPEITWLQPFGGKRWQSAMLAAVLIPVIIPLPSHVRDWWDQIATGQANRSGWSQTIADVHHSPGLAICEIPAICYWAGKPFVVDFFAFGQIYRESHQPLKLYSWIETRKIDVIILEKSYLAHGRPPRLPTPFPNVIFRNYQSIRVIQPGDINEMVPKTSGGTER